jgi:hypothetical protein
MKPATEAIRAKDQRDWGPQAVPKEVKGVTCKVRSRGHPRISPALYGWFFALAVGRYMVVTHGFGREEEKPVTGVTSRTLLPNVLRKRPTW